MHSYEKSPETAHLKCDDTWNMLNMQYLTPYLKRWDYSDIPGGGTKRLKDPPTWLKVTTTLKKDP